MRLFFKKYFLFIITFFIFVYSTFGQQKGYFQYPIYPGQKGTLAGAIGDLRANHFHAGIDVRTKGQEGLPVQASADGYISKIKIQTAGYGNVLFIKHPNGLTTVYGHLLKFNDEIGEYVRQAQYKKKTFEIELNPSSDQFPVKKGELIALSGNTGGSQGPHLHFEIRDAKDNYLNPLQFGFDEIQDDIAPTFQSVAFKPMNINSRIDDEFDRVTAKPIRLKDGTYAISKSINVWGQIGIELMAFDFMNGVQFRNGVNCIEIRVDGKEIFAYNMTSFPNWTTRDYNYLIDYATEQKVGVRYLKCYNPELNKFNLNKTDKYRGILNILDTLSHQVQITLFDSYENGSVLNLELKGKMPENETNESNVVEPNYLKSEAVENVLKLTAFHNSGIVSDALFYSKNKTIKLKPSYSSNNQTIFLLDLRYHLPDSVQVGSKILALNFKKLIVPNRTDNFNGTDFGVKFETESIFDTLYLSVAKTPNGLKVNDETIPLKDAIEINFKPESFIERPEKTHAYLFDNGRLKFLGGKWLKDRILFSTRDLGNYTIALDTIPPNISLRQSNKKRIEARISDNLSGIQSYSAYINNEWVLMNYDYKKALIWSEKLVDSLDFEGELRLAVSDRAGNIAILQTEIKEPIIVVKPKAKNVKSRRKSPKVRSQRPKRKHR